MIAFAAAVVAYYACVPVFGMFAAAFVAFAAAVVVYCVFVPVFGLFVAALVAFAFVTAF